MVVLEREERILWFVFAGLALVILIVIIGTYWYWRYHYHPVHGQHHRHGKSRRHSMSSKMSSKSKRTFIDEENGQLELLPSLTNDSEIIKTASVSKAQHGRARESKALDSPPNYVTQSMGSDLDLGSMSNLSMSPLHYYARLPPTSDPLPISTPFAALSTHQVPKVARSPSFNATLGSPGSLASFGDENKPLTRSESRKSHRSTKSRSDRTTSVGRHAAKNIL